MIKVREVEDTDLIPLAEFLPSGFPYTKKEFWLDQFSMWWTTNPAYTSRIPRGWVLDNDTKIAGFLGNIPVKYRFCGTTGIAAASNSWYVDPSVRGIYSIRLFTEYMKQHHASLFLFKEEDDVQIMKILARYKYTEHILPRSMTEYVYIINRRNIAIILVKFLFTRSLPKLSELPELFKRLGFLLFAYLQQKPVTTATVQGEQYTTSLCTSCDDSFSRIWEPFLQTCDIALSRDTATLNWLYFSPARPHKRVVVQCRRTSDASLAGYMVFEIVRKNPSETGIMYLLDTCIAENNPGVLSSLLSFAITTARGQNVAFLVVWADNEETETFLRRTFPMRRTARHYRFTRLSDAAQMDGKEKHPGTVCPSMIYPPQ
jgi:hypothetical protein